MRKKLYIAYGSNLNQGQMAWRCPTARYVGTGMIEGKLVVLRHGMAEVEDETDGIKLVTGENMKSANIYSINGKIAGRLTSDNIQEALDALPEGVYIINGKKYIK